MRSGSYITQHEGWRARYSRVKLRRASHPLAIARGGLVTQPSRVQSVRYLRVPSTTRPRDRAGRFSRSPGVCTPCDGTGRVRSSARHSPAPARHAPVARSSRTRAPCSFSRHSSLESRDGHSPLRLVASRVPVQDRSPSSASAPWAPASPRCSPAPAARSSASTSARRPPRQAVAALEASTARAVERERITEQERRDVLARFRTFTDLQAAADADLVIEVVSGVVRDQAAGLP